MPAKSIVTEHYKHHVATCQERWAAALEAERFDAAVVHAGSEMISFLDDYHYPFRPNPHLLAWAPLIRHNDSVLVVEPGKRPVLYYYQPDDYWYLPPSDPAAWWADCFDLRPVRDTDAWLEGVSGGRVAFIGDAPQIAGRENLNPDRLLNRLHLDRTRKTPYELACMAEASRVAARAHVAAEAAFREGCGEYEIHMRYCAAAGLVDAELPYGNIVALNANGAVLHYQERQHQRPAECLSFLIDGGATQQGYASDITRTYAADPGRFADMIEAMDAVQLDLCDAMRPGVDYRDLHLRAHEMIAGVLNTFGVIDVEPAAAVASGLSSVFFPHGLGHFLGIQTHDVAGLIADENGTAIPRPEGHPFLRLTRRLEPGNVLTVEPGLYFIDSLLRRWRDDHGGAGINWSRVEELRPYGGIRIEDNIVVTEGAPRNLTRPAFDELG
jgi:Xaa-Pro dipeptidase